VCAARTPRPRFGGKREVKTAVTGGGVGNSSRGAGSADINGSARWEGRPWHLRGKANEGGSRADGVYAIWNGP